MKPSARLLPLIAALLLCHCQQEEQGSTPTAPASEAPTEGQALIDSPTPSGENAYIHTQAFCDMGERITGSPAYEKQLLYLEKHLSALGWTTQRREFTAAGHKMVNLYATYGKTGSTKKYPILLSCHIDTKIGVSEKFVGANDGASGAAALIEIARILAKSPQVAEKIEIAFFDGEESFAWSMTEADGLFGSKWDADRREKEGTLPTWQINLDMVGGHRIPIAIPMVDTSIAMYREYSNAVEALKLSPTQWKVVNASYLDDHIPFLRKGVKSLNLIGQFTVGGWWHTEKDNMSIISKSKLEESCRMTLQLIKQLLESSNN